MTADKPAHLSLKDPMNPEGRKNLPRIYGATPSFLGLEPVRLPDGARGRDVVLMGVPFEGAVTWGDFSGCELAVKTIRRASARYGGYLADYDLDVAERLRLADAGDVAIIPADTPATLRNVLEAARMIYAAGARPVFFGGDHSYTPEIVRALAETTDGPVGVLHLDAHLDNLPDFAGDPFARCCPLYRVLKTPGVKADSVVHLGVRGPRNTARHMAVVRESGARLLTMPGWRRMGFREGLEQALTWAKSGTKAVYMTICSDILDVAHNPAGPPDFGGLTSQELFEVVHLAGRNAIQGLDFVEIYPLLDPHDRSSHLAVWTILHALAGLALSRAADPA